MESCFQKISSIVKLQLHDAIYRLRFYSNSLIHILLLSNSHNNVASMQKNPGDKSHRVIAALYVKEILVDNKHLKQPPSLRKSQFRNSICNVFSLAKIAFHRNKMMAIKA